MHDGKAARATHDPVLVAHRPHTVSGLDIGQTAWDVPRDGATERLGPERNGASELVRLDSDRFCNKAGHSFSRYGKTGGPKTARIWLRVGHSRREDG